jgi:nucleoid DNA-binding protein
MNEEKFIRDWRQCIFKRFGSFIVKTRAEKTGRNISKNTTKFNTTSWFQTQKFL